MLSNKFYSYFYALEQGIRKYFVPISLTASISRGLEKSVSMVYISSPFGHFGTTINLQILGKKVIEMTKKHLKASRGHKLIFSFCSKVEFTFLGLDILNGGDRLSQMAARQKSAGIFPFQIQG